MGKFLHQAEDILEIATSVASTGQELAIVVNRSGGIQMVDPSGWSLPALSAEYGAAAVYRVQRSGNLVRVEGWNGTERCLLQKPMGSPALSDLPGMAAVTYPRTLQLQSATSA